jgi:putative SOS response-associated peptidase YedK
MSDRFTQHFTWSEICGRYDLVGRVRDIEPRHDIEPTATVFTVASPWGVGNTLLAMRWGLIPSWWMKSASDVPATFKVHARGVNEPIFRSAFKRNRCIIPASGYFAKPESDTKQCYYVSAADGGILSIAGIWDEWNNIATGHVVRSCSMIITAGNAFIRAVHHQMPALLRNEDFERWLSGAAGTDVLKPADEDYLRMRAVPGDASQDRGDRPSSQAGWSSAVTKTGPVKTGAGAEPGR